MSTEKAEPQSAPSSLPRDVAEDGRDDNDGDGGGGGGAQINSRRLLTKIDLRILPILSLAYLFAFLDRVNIGNAAVFGLSEELGLRGTQYNVALTIFFVPYILFEIPSNILLKRFRPHRLLSLCIFMFGLTTVLQGFVTNYAGLLTTRFFLGLFETGLFPGCFYLLSMWYKREESQTRFTFFFISTTLASAFGGLLASGIGKMDGYGGKQAWRWIFILEGALTCLVAILGYFAIPDFPEDAAWLSDAEREWVTTRLRRDVGASGHVKAGTAAAAAEAAVRARDLQILYRDPKFILGALQYLGSVVPAYGFAYFAPTILAGWHYSPVQAQLRTVPVALAAWVFAMAVAALSDRVRLRYPFVVGCAAVTVAGFAVLLGVGGGGDGGDGAAGAGAGAGAGVSVRYGALFMSYPGVFAVMPIVVCYFQTNLAGHTRRSIGSAFQISFGNLGGIVATFLFVADDAPTYVSGYSTCIGFMLLTVVSSTVYMLLLRRDNRAREAGWGRGGVDGGEEGEEEEAGDNARGFRYIL